MIRVFASSVIEAPVEAIWPILRDFGATRRLTFADGGRTQEQLLALSDIDTTVTFAIIESELPIENYVSTIRLQRVTDGDRSFVTWSGEFDTPPDRAADMDRRMREDIYQPGFDALKRRFAALP